MPRWISWSVALIAVVALVSSGAYVMARWYALDGLVEASAIALEGSLYAIAGACGYAMLVGIYHTFLSVTGLDEEPSEGVAEPAAGAIAEVAPAPGPDPAPGGAAEAQR